MIGEEQVVSIVSSYTGLTSDYIEAHAISAPHRYRRYTVPKATRGWRIIMHPDPTTKAVQRALMKKVLYADEMHKVHRAAIAYRPGIVDPILHAVKQHSKYKYHVKADIHDYYPSITSGVLSSIYELYTSSVQTIVGAYTLARYPGRSYALAIGAPTSPVLSNMVMKAYDESLEKMLEKEFGAESYVYTRYADDMVVSCADEAMSRRVYLIMENQLKTVYSSALVFNQSKYRISKAGQRQMIYGLVISDDGNVGIGRGRYRKIRAKTKNMMDMLRSNAGSVDAKAIESLRGCYSHLRRNDRESYGRLLKRFGDQLLDLLNPQT